MFKTSFVDEETRATLERNSKYETVDNVHWTWRVTVFEYIVDMNRENYEKMYTKSIFQLDKIIIWLIS